LLNLSSLLDFIFNFIPMTVVERIKIVSDSYGKQKEFAAKVGMGEAALSYLFKNGLEGYFLKKADLQEIKL
jgi:hypothetical protein